MEEELASELVERAERDQAARRSLPPGQAMADWEAIVAPVDRDNEAGAHAAWLLAQHAPAKLQERWLPLLQDAVARDDASPTDLAYLMLMDRGEPQVYGTQYLVTSGLTSAGPRLACRRRPRTGPACWPPSGRRARARMTSHSRERRTPSSTIPSSCCGW